MKKCDVSVASNGVTFIQNFVKIWPLVQCLKGYKKIHTVIVEIQ